MVCVITLWEALLFKLYCGHCLELELAVLFLILSVVWSRECQSTKRDQLIEHASCRIFRSHLSLFFLLVLWRSLNVGAKDC